MGACFTHEGVNKTSFKAKSNNSSTESSSHSKGMEIEVIPPSEQDLNELTAEEFYRNPDKFLI